jgi:hypothetical protein
MPSPPPRGLWAGTGRRLYPLHNKNRGEDIMAHANSWNPDLEVAVFGDDLEVHMRVPAAL